LIVCLGFGCAVCGSAIHFHHELSLAAVKVHNVRANGMLSAELNPKRFAPQDLPKFALRRGHFAPQFSATLKVCEGNGRPVSMSSQGTWASFGEHAMVSGEPEGSSTVRVLNPGH